MTRLDAICDFNLSYLGCHQKHTYAMVDLVFVFLSFIVSLGYLTIIVSRILRGKMSKRLKLMDQVAIACLLTNCVRIGFRIFTWQNMTLENAVVHIRIALVFELLFIVFGGLALKLVVLSIAELASRQVISTPVVVFGYTINYEAYLRYLRLLIIIYYFVIFGLFSIVPFQPDATAEAYFFYRRLCYISASCVAVFLSTPVHLFFGYRLYMQYLEQKISGTKISNQQPTQVQSSVLDDSGIIQSTRNEPASQKESVSKHITLSKMYSNILYVYMCCLYSNLAIGMVYVAISLVNEHLSEDYYLPVKISTELILLSITSLTFTFMLRT